MALLGMVLLGINVNVERGAAMRAEYRWQTEPSRATEAAWLLERDKAIRKRERIELGLRLAGIVLLLGGMARSLWLRRAEKAAS